MKFTVITVCLNSEATIERTIKSVLGQDYPNIEYIIIDGGSVDSTINIIEKYKKNISCFISERDQGIYNAMNKGVSKSSGEWVHILNSDDWYFDSSAVSSIVPRLQNNCLNIFPTIKLDSKGNYIKINNSKKGNLWMYYSAYLPHPGLVVSSKQYEKVGKYNTKYKVVSDHDFIIRLSKIYKIFFHSRLLTVQQSGGYAAQNSKITLQEFYHLSIDNGFPKAFAYIIFLFKKFLWRWR